MNLDTVRNAMIKRAEEAQTYTVQPNDSLWTIARRLGTTVEALQAANPSLGKYIQPGQKLNLSPAQPAPRTQPPSAIPWGNEVKRPTYVEPQANVLPQIDPENWPTQVRLPQGWSFNRLGGHLGISESRLKSLNPQYTDPKKIPAGATINIGPTDRQFIISTYGRDPEWVEPLTDTDKTAMGNVENRNNVTGTNWAGARGKYQVTDVGLADGNRYGGTNYTMEDMDDPVKAWNIVNALHTGWGRDFQYNRFGNNPQFTAYDKPRFFGQYNAGINGDEGAKQRYNAKMTREQDGLNGVYTVQAGDTGMGIASKRKIPWTDFQTWNPDVDWKKIRPGQKLNIRAPQPQQPKQPSQQ